jgi:WD40 repeat protein
LTEWLEEDAAGRLVHQHLAQAAASWNEAGRDQGDLYRGTRLAAALEWTDEAGSGAPLNHLEREFLDESRQAFAREAESQHRANRRLRGLLVTAVLLLVAAATSSAIVLVERAHAQREANAAVAARLGAQALVEPSLDTSLLLAREGVNLDDSSPTRSNLFAALLRAPAMIGVAHTAGASVLDDALSPNGRLLAFRDTDGTVTFLDARTLRRVGHWDPPASELSPYSAIVRPVSALAFSPDSRTLAVGSSSESSQGNRGLTYLVDAQSHRVRHANGFGNLATVDVLYAPDGRTIVTGEIFSSNVSPPAEYVYVRSTTDADILASSAPIPAGRVIGFVDGGRRLLVTSGASRSFLLDARTLNRVDMLHEGGAAAVSKHGDVAAFGHPDGSIVLVHLQTGSATTIKGHAGAPIESLAFSADGTMLASTGSDGSVAVWDVPTATLRETFAGHTASAVDPVFSRNGDTLYAGSADGSVIAWDVRGERRLGRPFRFSPVPAAGEGPQKRVLQAATAVAVSPDGSLFATSPARNRITIWRSRDEARVGELHGPSGAVKSLAFSHDGRLVAAVGTSPSIVVWDLRRRKVVRVLRQGPTQFSPPSLAWSYAVAFSPNDRLVASAGNSGLQVFVLRSGRFAGSATSGGSLSDLAFSADGRFLAAAGPSGGILVWDVRRRTQVRVINFPATIAALRFAPHGTTIAAGDDSGDVDFWDAATGRPLSQTLSGQNGSVLSVSFDPTGARLMTASTDGKIRLWDLTTEKLIGAPLAGADRGGWGTFFPDGKRLIAVFPSGTGVIWNVDPASWSAHACRVAGRNLSRTEWHNFLPNLPFHTVCG